MFYFILAQIVSTLLELVLLHNQTERHKDLQILLLRRQLDIVTRKLDQPPPISRAEKFILALLAFKLKRATQWTAKQFKDVLRVFQPETVLKWHRELVRRKWTYPNRRSGGRPSTDAEVAQLVIQLARQNDWGYRKIEGELMKLGYGISVETIRKILKRHGIPPSAERQPSPGWRHLMTHYKEQLLACDFFTVETLFLQTVYVLFFIELGTRRVHFAGCTTHPTGAWVTQQGRQMIWKLEDHAVPMRFLIHDNDRKFTSLFDTVFASEQITVIHTPYGAPNANACAERWVRTVREECLNKLLIFNEPHLQRVLREYTDYYNHARPHQGIAQQIPFPKTPRQVQGLIHCRNVLGGILHDYSRIA
jgi:putative transposase